MAKKSTLNKKTGGIHSGPGRWLLQIVALIGVVYGVFWWRLNSRVDAIFEQINLFTPASHGRASFGLNGDINVTRIRIDTPPNQKGGGAMRIERLSIHTPGLMWLLKASFAGIDGREPDHLGMTLTNFEFDAPKLMANYSAIGAYSGALFEADGCGATNFSRDDLRQMGLPQADSQMNIDFRQLGNDSAEVSISAGTPGYGSVDASITVNAAGLSSNTAAAAMGTLNAASLTFRDEGFIAARNTWCGTSRKLSATQFVDRHMDAVRDMLRTAGLQADAPLEAMYRTYASNGGELTIMARPQGQVKLAELGRYNVASLRQLLSPIVQMQGQDPVLLALNPYRAPEMSDTAEVGPDGQPLASSGVAAQPATAGAAPPYTVRAPASATVAVEPRTVQQAPPLVAYAGGRAGDLATESNEYEQLGQALGQEVVIRTTNGTTRRGVLLHYSKTTIDLQLGPHDGGIQLSIPRNSVKNVGVVVATAPPAPVEQGTPDAKTN